jgi:outer membrane protein OmpA-like peptidoglycan-associated protein
MSERNGNINDNSLSDVEKFFLLLSELNIIESQKTRNSENQNQSLVLQSEHEEQFADYEYNSSFVDLNSENEEPKIRSRLVDLELSQESLDEPLEMRSPSVYPFPSLLDELPFLKNIQPIEYNDIDNRSNTVRNNGNGTASNARESLPLAKVEESETINLIQDLLLGGGLTLDQTQSNLSKENELSVGKSQSNLPIQSEFQPQQLGSINQNNNQKSDQKNTSSYSSASSSLEDDQALHLLQDILVVPEIEDLRSFKISVEQKLGIVESQVNSPALMDKIEGLESLIQNASLGLSSLGSRLTEIDNENDNIPTEIAGVRERVAQLENRINEPDELVQLLLPVIADILSLKVTESRESMCQAIMPIIAEVIFERSQLDRVAMSHAISDILPSAISEHIHSSPEGIAKAIAPEMGAAIREQIRLDRDAIIDAIAPEMGSAIKRQIALERDSMVDALYPVIGNTIAKYFAEAIRSINEKVEQTFSVGGLQRKLRAKIQGVSEAELILKESVPFEVQAIFLIHNLSGLVMVDIQQSDLNALIEPLDSDMLAGMLTAIRSFANECMSRSSEEKAEIDAINYSGSQILLEVAGYCYLAVIIRGEPDSEFVTKIRDVFGQIVQVYGDRLKQFDGDPSMVPFKVHLELKTLMEVEKTQPKKSSKALIFLGLALFALVLVPMGIYQYQSQRDRQIEAKVLEAFASTPELAVYRLNVAANGQQLKLSGKLPNQNLRDRALQVANEVTKTEIAIANINNNIYTVNIPPDPILVAAEVQRLTKVLNYTQGVNIATQFNNGQLTITGQVEQPSMIPKITQTFTKIAGITAVTNATILIVPKLSTRIYFPFGVTILQPSELEKLIEVKAFLDMYPDYSLKISAKSDNIGDRTVNYQLGVKRTQALRDALLQKGINANRLHISGIIEPSIQQPSDQIARWVEFEPTLK